MRRIYNDFVGRMVTTTELFIDHVNAAAESALAPENDFGCDSLVLHSAVSSVLYKLLTVKLTQLRGRENTGDAAPPEE